MLLTALPDSKKSTPGPPDPPENTVILADSRDRYDYPEHETPYLFVTQLHNRGQYTLNGRGTTVSPRQFYFLNPRDAIGINHAGGQQLKTCLILFRTGFVESCVGQRMVFSGLPFELTERVSQTLTRLANRDECDRDTLLSGQVRAVHRQDRIIEQRLGRLSASRRSTREELYRRLATARAFMLDNITQPLSLEQIAKEACLNKFHFLDSFRSAYQTTPHRWFTELKLQKALHLLQSGKHRATEVCYLVGFQSPSSFTTLFKKRFNTTPSQIIPNFR